MSETEDARSAEATDRESARGAVFITFAKMWFMATGFLQPLVLTRLLGTEGYGLYALALSTVSIVNNVVVTGSIQSMSNAVIHGGSDALRRALRLHAIMGLVLGGALALCAVPLGEGLLRDAKLPALLRVGAIVVADYSVYAALVGAFNGRRNFAAQAGLDVTFSTLRTALVLGLAWRGFGAIGAVSGFAVASAVIVVVALIAARGELARRGDASASAAPFSARRYASFFAPVLLYQLALNLVLQVDGLLFKGLMSRQGMGEAEVNTLVGVYKAVQNFAFLPYQLLVAVTFVVFPVVNRATMEGDKETTRRFIEGALRFSAMAVGAMLSVLVGVPRGVLLLAYRPPFDDGAHALRTLAMGQGAFGLSVIGATIILAAGRVKAATALMAWMLACVVVGDVIGVSISRGGVSALDGLSAGSSVGWALGLAGVGWYLRRNFGAFLGVATAARVMLATALAALAAQAMPLHGKVGTLVTAAVTVVVYVGLLFATGELGRAELARIRRLAQRR